MPKPWGTVNKPALTYCKIPEILPGLASFYLSTFSCIFYPQSLVHRYPIFASCSLVSFEFSHSDFTLSPSYKHCCLYTMHACSVAQSCETPWIAACQAPLSMEFFRQEYWWVAFSSSGIFPTQGSNPCLLHLLNWKWEHLEWKGGLPRWFSSKESACNAAYSGLIPGLGQSPGGWLGNPFQYSCLKNPMNRGA